MSDNKIKSNLKWSKYITLTANIIGAVLFFVAYRMNGEIWFLIASILLIFVCGFSIYFFSYLNKKIDNILNQSEAHNG